MREQAQWRTGKDSNQSTQHTWIASPGIVSVRRCVLDKAERNGTFRDGSKLGHQETHKYINQR